MYSIPPTQAFCIVLFIMARQCNQESCAQRLQQSLVYGKYHSVCYYYHYVQLAEEVGSEM